MLKHFHVATTEATRGSTLKFRPFAGSYKAMLAVVNAPKQAKISREVAAYLAPKRRVRKQAARPVAVAA